MFIGPVLVTHQEENSVKLKLKKRRHNQNLLIRTFQVLFSLFCMYSTKPHGYIMFKYETLCIRDKMQNRIFLVNMMDKTVFDTMRQRK